MSKPLSAETLIDLQRWASEEQRAGRTSLPIVLAQRLFDHITHLEGEVARVALLEKLVASVHDTDYDGICCGDVDGNNWFDLRKEALPKD